MYPPNSFSYQLPCHSLAFYQTIACLGIALSHFLNIQTIASSQSHSTFLQPPSILSLITHYEQILTLPKADVLSAYLLDFVITKPHQTNCPTYSPDITHNIVQNTLQSSSFIRQTTTHYNLLITSSLTQNVIPLQGPVIAAL